jgi:hypothetical protein
VPKCVIRTDLRHQPVGSPLSCVELSEMFYRAAGPTVEECIQMLLVPDEICLGLTDRRQIMQGARVVGYIRIVDICLDYEAPEMAGAGK